MNKYLGQYFLKNRGAIKEIVNSLDLQPDDTIIEIGPGKGALTIPLARKCRNLGCKLIAIEKDDALARKLVNSNWKLEIVEGDVLKILPSLITNYHLPFTNYKIVGNIPYYITGKLLRLLGELITNYKLPITNIVLMLQKEVAERIVARPRGMNPVRGREGPQRTSASNGMNLLAAATQFWAEPKILFTLKPKDFKPQPGVESAVIRLETRDMRQETRKEKSNYQLLITNYYQIIKIVFKQPRKTLMNNLRAGLKLPKNEIENVLKKLKIRPKSRPQNLSIEQIKSLSKFCLGKTIDFSNI